ncbi:MFS transporter [Actinosynnema sp. NPDC004786]
MTGYRELLARPLTWWWLVATVATRLAVCTVPLAAVFLAAEHTGSYAWGAVIAGAYAAGEAVAAPRMGARFQRRPLRPELSRVAVAEAVALLGLVVSLRLGLPVAAVVLAAVGGGVAAGTFGGLRTLLVRSAPDGRGSALALDVIVNQACQVAGPALVGVAVAVWSADAALLVVAAALLVTPVVAGRLPGSLGAEGDAVVRGSARVVRAIWPAVVVVTVVLALQAAVEVTLPSLLEHRGAPAAWAGAALSALAVSSIAGSFLYGLRRRPGNALRHTLVLASLFALVVVAVGVVRSPVATVVLVGCAGFFQAAASTARSLTVTEALPAGSWSVGFSVLYSFAAVGFTAASVVSAVFLAAGDAAVFSTALGVGACAVFALVGAVERGTRGTS